MKRAFRVGVGGPVGSGKTALVEQLVPRLLASGLMPAVVANDVFTTEDERILRRGLAGVLDEGRIVGVETGSCPHTAVREDPTANLAAIDALVRAYPETDVVLVESGGDNLTLTFSPLLADCTIYVMDVAAGEKMPRKQGPGMIQADLLVINKADLAPHVGASLEVMERDARTYRQGPLVFTNCRGQDGIDEVAAWLVDRIRSAAAPNATANSMSLLDRLAAAGPYCETPVGLPPGAMSGAMSAAEMCWREDGRPDWGGMWQSWCGLALFGGPSHRSEETALHAPVALAERTTIDLDAAEEIRRGILETTGLVASPAESATGWLAVACDSPRMAAWMAASIILENVEARCEGACLLVPAHPTFRLTDEVKSVITVVAKVHHYWQMTLLAR